MLKLSAQPAHFPSANENKPMKIIFASLVAAGLLAAGAAFVLNAEQRSAYEAFTTSGARVGDPGHNLVGDKWDGRGQDQQSEGREGA
jgi:hypothetical protein